MDKSSNFFDLFLAIPDPRVERRKKHLLMDIIIMTIIGVICRCNNWIEISDFAEAREDWFKEFLDLPNGIPSHDTFGRVFSLLDPLKFQMVFFTWASGIFELKEGDIIGMDGKYFKSSLREPGRPRSIIGMVSAFLTNSGAAIALKKTDFKKEGEKKIFKELIELLKLKGVTVTLDAYGCHANITNRIIEKEGNYVVALKSNQKSFHRQANDVFENYLVDKSEFETIEKGHGRIEHRKYTTIPIPKSIVETLAKKVVKRKENKSSVHEDWKGLKTLIQVKSDREINGIIKSEIRTYISSLPSDAKKLSEIIRSRWDIENKQHYILDMSFDEDRSRLRRGNSGENFAIVRRMVLNLFKRDTSNKKSIQVKRLRASLDQSYLYKIIRGLLKEDFVT